MSFKFPMLQIRIFPATNWNYDIYRWINAHDIQLFTDSAGGARKKQLLVASISDQTRQVYSSAMDCFENFRLLQKYASQWPPLLLHVTDFIAYLSLPNYSPSTARSYISAIGYHCKISGFADVTQSFIVKKMLTGLNRIDKRRDIRMPITVDILQKILHSLPFICFSNYEIGLFSVLFSLTFFGFFRVGELVVESPLKQGHALQSHNIRFILRTNSLEIVIPHSKTDQNGKGSVLLIPPTYMPMCAVKTVKQYMNLRPPHLGPFFCHLSGLPVTKYQFVSVLRKCLNFANIDT
ncbi:hypothetical protein KUTeg_011345 [Tegillarca granosa]|uniref:Uncharacterized protein n=1 Tax=Tegillarca granosa TaxID=220873 RepID=A0ABQ9F134_TEGGR|nr:hypothetical protein KUTeg_011345 [Tegillarca granosa]